VRSEHGHPVAAADQSQGQIADERPGGVAGEARERLGEEKQLQRQKLTPAVL
jgi:hypothetical protein